MRPKDLKIGTQLRLGLSLLFVLVAALGALAWRQADLLWQQTRTMYDHPLQVRRALGVLEVDVERMSQHVRDLFLARSDEEFALSLQRIEVRKRDAELQLAKLHDRYLGPRSDVKTLQDDLMRWHASRDETIRLLRAGKSAEAQARVGRGGAQDAAANAVRNDLRTIDDFARAKGDELYRRAMAEKDALTRRLIAIIAAALLLSLATFWVLLRAIRDPLDQLTDAAERFQQGELDARSAYASANEFGVVTAAFNGMAETVGAQIRVNEQAAELAAVMLRETEARAFCRELLKALVGHTGSQVGAVYLLNPEGTEFVHFESIGLGAAGRASFSATSPEGEFGTALATGRMQRIRDIPDDTRFTFAGVAGEFRPREIITIPLVSDHRSVAVLSLASVRAYSEDAVRLLGGIESTLTARMNGLLAFRQVQELARRLEAQNSELAAQQRELGAQASELTEQNTELEMQKKQLDEANRLKSAFLSNMSHELRTPLNSVIALSGVLTRRLGATIPAEELGYLEVIERNGKHLLALINDILDLSRIEAGREEIRSGPFSLAALVDEVVAMVGPQAREKGLALLDRVGEELPDIVSDRQKCRQILQNLVANAVKFTEAGSVEVSARLAGDEIHVAVRDTGIGIAADQLPRIFEEFRQADDSASRRYGGTGLGLAIAARYAGLLHGGITVESAPGQGSTFTLRLPLALAAAGPGSPETGSADEPGVPRGGQAAAGEGVRRILLVEDNEPAVIQLTEILNGQGYEVRVARDGREALEQIGASLPDAVILDLMMPEMDGFEVLQQIRGTARTVALPVLILTARHVTREELSILKGNHIHQLIQKGDISKAELLAAVGRMVATRREGPTRPRSPGTRVPRPDRPLVLVVEDNPDNLRTMRALLQETCAVVEAADGRAAVEQARRYRPDLVLMDLALPVMDGFAALAGLREDAALRDIPVVAVTASAMKGDREQVLARGFDGYLSKPVDAARLDAILREVLHGA